MSITGVSFATLFDTVSRILTVAATLAFACLAMFNVGYFMNIGLHFLGIVDLNNFVYSFGLAFALCVFLAVVASSLIELFSEPKSEMQVRRSLLISTVIAFIGFAGMVLPLVTPLAMPLTHIRVDALVTVVVKLAGAIIFLSGWLVRSFIYYKASGVITLRSVAIVVVMPLLIFYETGDLMARFEKIAPITYTIITIHGPPIKDARLLRASSAGFIVFAEERVLFIAQSQIAQIKETGKTHGLLPNLAE